jgi:hypothetical protein
VGGRTGTTDGTDDGGTGKTLGSFFFSLLPSSSFLFSLFFPVEDKELAARR